jgi:hypothetical protein
MLLTKRYIKLTRIWKTLARNICREKSIKRSARDQTPPTSAKPLTLPMPCCQSSEIPIDRPWSPILAKASLRRYDGSIRHMTKLQRILADLTSRLLVYRSNRESYTVYDNSQFLTLTVRNHVVGRAADHGIASIATACLLRPNMLLLAVRSTS